MYQDYEREYNIDGSEKHINKDGARYHVMHWDAFGAHCSEPNCEVNVKPNISKNALIEA